MSAKHTDTEAIHHIGTCDHRHGENLELHAFCDDIYVCDECLDSDFTKCDVCGEYWKDSASECDFRDDMSICEYCLLDTDEGPGDEDGKDGDA